MKMRLIFIGQHGKRTDATNGEIVKNRLLVKRFRELYNHVYLIDLYDFKKHIIPFVFNILGILLLHPKVNVVFSCSSDEGYRFIRFFSLINRNNVYYWVVGGSFADRMLKGDFKLSPYKKLRKILVQSETMVNKLKQLGLNQTIFIRNTKPIDYIPAKTNSDEGLIKFVFLSRISVAKGCDYIFEATKELNNNGFRDKFRVVFYGKIEEGYSSFLKQIEEIPNAEYGGFMDLEDSHNYDLLSSYDVMLFPTYWQGEGFAGIFIDAFISGLPIIASDWNCNKEFITEDIGIIVPTHSLQDLVSAMRKVITGEVNIKELSINCQKKARTYDINSVISESELKRIGLL